MALKINKALTTPDGGTVASGAIIKFTTVFPEGVRQDDVQSQIVQKPGCSGR